MKYNALLEFHIYLEKSCLLLPSTALTYYKAMCQLLSDQYILNCRDLDVQMIWDKLKEVKYKNQYSKYKNAFLKFCSFQNIQLSPGFLYELESMNEDKKKRRRKLKVSMLKNINDKIRVISDKKLKLSYYTMLSTGMRVSELSQIKKEDCLITQDLITFHILGKGRKEASITVSRIKNKFLFDELMELIDSANNGDKLFYSSNHLQTNAKKRGFQCHDLRRAFAKLEFQKYKDVQHVMEGLRHSKKHTTKIYLRSKLKI